MRLRNEGAGGSEGRGRVGTLERSPVAPGSENARRGVVVLRVQDGHARMVDVTVQGGPAAVLAPAVVVVRAHVAPVRHLEPRANLSAGPSRVAHTPNNGHRAVSLTSLTSSIDVRRRPSHFVRPKRLGSWSNPTRG